MVFGVGSCWAVSVSCWGSVGVGVGVGGVRFGSGCVVVVFGSGAGCGVLRLCANLVGCRFVWVMEEVVWCSGSGVKWS